MSSNDESREIVNGGGAIRDGIDELERYLNELARLCVENLKTMRDNFNWEEKEAVELVGQIHPLIREWHGPYPNLREIFRPKEIDLLLKDSIVYTLIEMDDNPGEAFLDFVVDTGYKDDPEVDGEVDVDGNPLLRRTTPIHLAAYEEDHHWLLELFKIYDRFDLNFVDHSGYTHFHAACEFGCNEAVRKFLELGLNPNIVAQGWVDPPLHLALAWGDKDMVRLLLEHGADPNVVNNEDGFTALHVVSFRNESKQGADDDTAELFFAVDNKKHQPVQIDARDKSGNTPLHLALDYCLKFTACILLRRGADVNLVNAEGMTPLHIICRKDHDAELVKIYFEITDDVQLKQQLNAVDEKGRTPLQLAVANLLPDVVEFLLDRGADLSGFVFPSESDLNEEFELQDYNMLSDSTLRLASGMLACVELLEKRGYQLDRSDALAIMNVFAKQNVFEKPTDLDESFFDDESFARETKVIEVRPGLSLYDLMRTPPAEATKLLTYTEYFRFSRSKYSQYHRQGPREACTARLCQILSRGFFQRWSMDPVMKLIRYQLPILCCAMIIQQLSNKDLLNICLALKA